MGYHGKSAIAMDKPWRWRLLNKRIELGLSKEGQGFRYMLELHWGLFLGDAFDRAAVEALWADAHAVSIFGIKAFEASVEWTLLFLAVHAARHRWRGLKWLSDIHELCNQKAIEWAKVRFEAERVGWEDAVELTLNACHTLFDTPIPPHFSPRTLSRWVRLYPADSVPAEAWQRVLVRARLFKSPLAQWRYFMRALLVPTETDRQFIRLPAAVGVLYFPLRLLRISLRYAWRFGAGRLLGVSKV
jgi:hypothetical protein